MGFGIFPQHLLDIPPMIGKLEGVKMEVDDCAFPLVARKYSKLQATTLSLLLSDDVYFYSYYYYIYLKPKPQQRLSLFLVTFVF